MFDQWFAEGDASRRVVAREGDGATHAGDGGDGVVDARDVEHRRNLLDPIAFATDQVRRSRVQRELGGRQRAGAELVLEPVDADVAQCAILIAKPNEEDTQPVPFPYIGKCYRDL